MTLVEMISDLLQSTAEKQNEFRLHDSGANEKLRKSTGELHLTGRQAQFDKTSLKWSILYVYIISATRVTPLFHTVIKLLGSKMSLQYCKEARFTFSPVNDKAFARYSHMVRNKLCWDANNAVELPKQRKVGLDWYEFFCFRNPTALFAFQHNLFPTMWPDRAKVLLQHVIQVRNGSYQARCFVSDFGI